MIFDEGECISGGNFHAEVVGFVADHLALAISEIGAISERKIALMVDSKFSGLSPFLVESEGLNSGFMMAQVTAAALASENKQLTLPATADSIPTSVNQEDHVSMATYAARRLGAMIDNSRHIVGIELLCACQAVDLRKPLKTSPLLEKIKAQIRDLVPYYSEDRVLSSDIQAVAKWLKGLRNGI